jgi:hypothetical protein
LYGKLLHTYLVLGHFEIKSTQLTLVQICAHSGLYAEGQQELDKSISIFATGSGRHLEAEFYRLRGVLALAQALPDNLEMAEADFRKAIEVAHQHAAHGWELRASINLARLWHQQDKASEARELLGGIFGLFTEGFDTPDLQEALTLLEELQAGK